MKDLYSVNEKIGQGLPTLFSNYLIIQNIIKDYFRRKQKELGFKEVATPILGSEFLYKTSGHLEHYKDSMYPAINYNNEKLFLRPMTCPHHCLIFCEKLRSYRDLPFRICENSLVFRHEFSGSLKGL